MDIENNQTVKSQNEKIKRLKDALNAHSTRYSKQDKKFKEENEDLTEDFKRITEQFKGLQKKYHHFEIHDQKKFEDVWKMNENQVMEVVSKVLKADEIIHEQILGIDWENPPLPTDMQLHQQHEGKEGNVVSSSRLRARFSDNQIRQVLTLLATEGTFLIDKKLKERLANLDTEEKEIYTIDSILASLGVIDREDLEELTALFYEDETSSEISIELNDVVKVLKNYLFERQRNKKNEISQQGSNPENVSKEKTSRRQKRERLFWLDLANVVDESKLALWNAAEKSLLNYNDLLAKRANLLKDTNSLAQQNAELKEMLDQALSSETNQQLLIPPTKLVHMKD